METIIYLDTKFLKPYKGNPRKITEDAVDAVAASIKEFGFRSPIVIDSDYTIINGHTRYQAAKKLKLEQVPCIKVEDLTEEQIRKFRIIDNKSAEYSKWDADKLAEELFDLDLGLDFDFDFTDDLQKKEKWKKNKVMCDLKECLGLHRFETLLYHSMYKCGKKGKPIEEIKKEENVEFIAKTASELITQILGPNLESGDWCILTTPRRRHKTGFHFASAVCSVIAEGLNIPYYEDAFETDSRNRVDPIFNMLKNPEEKNVIVYDDILTTGYTLKEVKDHLIDSGHIVFPVISINNH